MKRILLLNLCILVFANANAQEPDNIPSLFEITPMAEETSKSNIASKRSNKMKQKIKNIRKNRLTKELRKINFVDISKYATDENKGFFKMSIPKSKKGGGYKNVLIVPQEIQTKENGDYYYFGDLVHGKITKGSIVIIKEGNEHYGSIQMGNRDFQILNIGSNDQLLIEKKATKKNSCVVKNLPEGKNNLSSKSTFDNARSNKSTCSKKVRVLALYTTKANRVSNPSSVANSGIYLFNSAKNSSRVYNSDLVLELAGVRSLSSFVESNDIGNDLERAQNDASIRVLRNQYQADLVVVLTDGNYGNTLGQAALFDYGNPNKGHVALVEANGGSWVFPHETGHLLGCQHDVIQQQAPNVPTSSKGHNWYYRKGIFNVHKWQKSIVAGGGAKGYFVSRFSNPAVKYESRSVGNTGRSDRNNSLQLKNSACTVSNYIVGEPAPPLGVGINGPYSATIYQEITLSANVSNCSGSRTYKWERSYNGYSYSNIGSGSSIRIRPYSNDNIYIRLTVNCSNGSKTVFRTIPVYGGGGTYQKSAKATDSIISIEEPVSIPDISVINYPNPASDILSIASGYSDSKTVKIYLYDLLNGGKKRRIYQGNLNSSNPLDIDISNFNQGLYRLEVFENGKTIFRTKQLISR